MPKLVVWPSSSMVPDPVPLEKHASTLVEQRFGLSSELVREYDLASAEALQALSYTDFSIPTENLEISFDLQAPPIAEPPLPTLPGEYTSALSDVAFSDLDQLRQLLGLIEVVVGQTELPVLNVEAPQINFPDVPDDEIPDIDGDPPEVGSPELPVSPDLDLPPVPVLEDIQLPATPAVHFQPFEGVMPDDDLTFPEPMFVYDETTYQSDLQDAVRTKLYNDVVLGGTGLSAEVEDAIWQRALDRLDIELEKVYTQTLTNFESWGFEMPDGALSGNLREVISENNRRRVDLNRDVMFKQAELAQQNTHFAITNGLVYEKQVMDLFNQAAQRSFEAARYRHQAVIETYKARVVAFTAKLEGFKALAQVYESQIRAELGKVEVYRAQMEGAKIHGELQKLKVDIYARRVEALNTLINLYRAQMEGAKLHVEVDLARIQGFRARVDAMSAKIGAITAKYNLYQAQIAGEVAKVELYGRQVQAYEARVRAAGIGAEINRTVAQAEIEANNNRIALLTAAVDKYRADTQHELGKEDANVRAFTAKAGMYDSEVRREGTHIDALVARYRNQVAEATAQAELILKEADSLLRTAVAAKDVQVEAIKAAANILAQKSASALASVSASAQLGYNESMSNAYQGSVSKSGSYNMSTAFNYNWGGSL